jgi:hypothetical protein
MPPSPYELPTRWLEWHEEFARLASDLEREKCCKDVCVLCAEGRLVIRDSGWRHFDNRGIGLICTAHAIRERAWQEANEKS